MAGIISTLPTYESNECDIIIDGNKKITSNVTMAVVANGKFLGGGFNAHHVQIFLMDYSI